MIFLFPKNIKHKPEIQANDNTDNLYNTRNYSKFMNNSFLI